MLILAVAMKSPGEITAALVIIPIVSLLTLIWVRILLELVIIIFRIGEDVRHISLFAGLRGRPEEQGVVTTAAFASKLDTAERAHVGQLSHTVPTSTEEAQVSPGPTHVEETPRSDQPVAGWYPDPQFEGYLPRLGWRVLDGPTASVESKVLRTRGPARSFGPVLSAAAQARRALTRHPAKGGIASLATRSVGKPAPGSRRPRAAASVGLLSSSGLGSVGRDGSRHDGFFQFGS